MSNTNADSTTTSSSRRRPARVRPEDQQAQLILRMHPDQRAQVHELAKEAGHESAGAYLLDLAARDAQRRGVGEADVIAGMFAGATAESPGPQTGDQGSHAMAGHAVPAAAG